MLGRRCHVAAILQPAVPDTGPPPFPHGAKRLLTLMANWREAALELGEFDPAPPAAVAKREGHLRQP